MAEKRPSAHLLHSTPRTASPLRAPHAPARVKTEHSPLVPPPSRTRAVMCIATPSRFTLRSAPNFIPARQTYSFSTVLRPTSSPQNQLGCCLKENGFEVGVHAVGEQQQQRGGERLRNEQHLRGCEGSKWWDLSRVVGKAKVPHAAAGRKVTCLGGRG